MSQNCLTSKDADRKEAIAKLDNVYEQQETENDMSSSILSNDEEQELYA